MITAEKIKKLVELFEADSDLTSMSSQTGFGFLMEGSVPKFQKIESGRYTPRIIHPMYLYLDHWGGKSLRVYLSQKLTPLVGDQSELGYKPGFEYWTPAKNSPLVVKRYLYASDYADDSSLEAVVQETLRECARVYLTVCQEWGG
ncbi:MAG: hypothetical protein DDT21_02544 [Syntrophomonadaceae bacterium]|nr:hypothetical protein [Bacillota bacterium]